VKDKSQVSGGIERFFGPRWLGILIMASLLVLALAWVLSGAYSVEGWRRLLGWFDPVFEWLGRMMSWVLVKLLQLLGPVIEWLVNTIRELLGSRGLEQSEAGPFDSLLQQMREDAGEYGGPPAWLAALGRYVCPGVSIVAALLVIVIWLERRRRWQRRVVEDESQPLWDEARDGTGPSGLLRRGWDRLQRTVARLGQLGSARRLYAAISVRYIYANVIRLAERRGFPRPPACTPNEFEPTLSLAFPGHEQDLARLTAAYVNVHYGEVPSDHAELREIRSSWERLRREPAKVDEKGEH